MKIDKICEKIYEEYKTQELNRQESLTRVMKPNSIRNPFELEKINNELLIENEKLIKKVKALYEAIDEHYTEVYQNPNYLQVVRAETKLKLMTKIIDEVERI